VELVAKRF
jgi:hypothetical protein